MTSYLGLYVLINMFCVVLILIFTAHSRIGMGKTLSQRRFAMSMLMLIVFFLSDTVWYAMDQGAITQNLTVSMVLKSIYFLSTAIAGYLWLLYMASISGVKYIEKNTFKYVALIIVAAHFILLVINFSSHILFHIDENFVYHRGPLFALQYVFIYSYLVLASATTLAKAFRPENYLDKLRYIIIALFPVFPGTSGIVQLFYWRIPFNCIGFTIGVVVVYLVELGQQVRQEPLTQLTNHKQFMRVLEQNVSNRAEHDGQLYLLMMDIDKFKHINDTYGHLEGDRAIVATAEALKRAANKLRRPATLARYGGDEFALITELENEDALKMLKDNICNEMERASDEINSEYKLTLSIGTAKWDPETMGARDLITAADNAMYREKSWKA